MAGQDLLDQRGAGSRQAEDEDRPLGFQSGTGTGQPGEQARIERAQKAIDELLVLGRLIIQTLLRLLPGDRVGTGQAVSGTLVIAEGVEHVGQGEQQPGARSLVQRGVGQSGFERGQVGGGQLATEERRQPGVGDRETRLMPDRGSVSRLGPIHRADELVETTQVQVCRGQVGLELHRGQIARAGLVQMPFVLQGPTERQVRRDLTRLERQHATPAGDRFIGLVPLVVNLGQPLPDRGGFRLQRDGFFQPGNGFVQMAPALQDQPDVRMSRHRSASSPSASQ